MEVIRNKRILALVGIVGLILGCFLPYYTFSFFGYTQSISLLGYWEGKIVLLLTLANALFIFQDFIEKYVPQLFDTNLGIKIKNANPKMAILPTIGIAVFAVWLYIRLDVDTTYLKHGLGFWCLWIGVICLIGHTFLYKNANVNQSQINYSQINQSNDSQVQSQSSIQQVQQSMQPEIDSNKKICPHCRNQVDVNAENCFLCGNKF